MKLLIGFLVSILCFEFISRASAQSEPAAPDAAFCIKILARPELIEFYVAETEKKFPDGSIGTTLSFPWLPSKKFLLTRLFDTSFGTTPATIPWRANSAKLVYDWTEIEKAFETEIQKIFSPPAIAATEPNPETAKPIVPGTIEHVLTTEELDKLGKITSLLFVVAPNEVTLVGAVMAQGLIAMNKLTGKEGIIAGYNPFFGVSYFVPQSAEEFTKKVGAAVGEAAKDAASSGLGGTTLYTAIKLTDAIKEGHVDQKTIVNQVVPALVLGVPLTKQSVEVIIHKPIEGTTDVVDKTVVKPIRKFFKKVF